MGQPKNRMKPTDGYDHQLAIDTPPPRETSLDLWTTYSARSRYIPIGGVTEQSIKNDREAYAEWEQKVIEEIINQDGIIKIGQQWGGHSSVESFLNR